MRTPANSQTTRKPILILTLALLIFGVPVVIRVMLESPPTVNDSQAATIQDRNTKSGDQQDHPERIRTDLPPAPKRTEKPAQIVHFATNRQVEYRDGRLTFDKQPGPLALGKAHMIVGDGYQPGELTHISIESLAIQGKPDDLNALFPDANAKTKPVLIFVHGYFVEFEEAIQRVTQIVHELKYDGHVFVYTWPSVFDVSFKGYRKDQKAIDASVKPFRQFLDIIAGHFGAENVQLFGHSLGCRLIAKTIQSLPIQETPRKETCFQNVMFVAPDIELNAFKQDCLPALKTAARRVTIYFSSKDRTLWLAETVGGRPPRLGRTGLRFGAHAPIELVDYSALPGGVWNTRTHYLFREHPELVGDIRRVLTGLISSADRKIQVPLNKAVNVVGVERREAG